MRKGYLCQRYPSFLLGSEIRFSGGVFSTEDERLQQLIEQNEWFGIFIKPADEASPLPIVPNAPNVPDRRPPVRQAEAPAPPVDTPECQPEGLRPPGYKPKDAAPLPVDEYSLPPRDDAAKRHLGELAALAVSRGIQIPARPNKATLLDLIYGPVVQEPET